MSKRFFNYGIPVIILILAFVIPTYSLSFDVSVLLTVVSLLFAILVGFFISAATTNYLRLQCLIAQEDGTIISLYNLCKIVSPSACENVAEAIDEYVIAALDHELEHYINNTKGEFEKMYQTAAAVRPESEVGMAVFQNFQTSLNALFPTRDEINLVTRRLMHGLHWSIVSFQAVLICVLLFSFRHGDWFTSLIVGALAIATFLILLLIYEIDGDTFQESGLAYENSQQIFKYLGRLPYYPEDAIKNNRVRMPKTDYRLGMVDKNAKKEISIVHCP